MFKGLEKRFNKGFTLVEMLVVMAIIAILIGIAIAGLGFAMRRSRNIARKAMAQDFSTALVSHYADEQNYPGQNSPHLLAAGGTPPGVLNEYMDGMFEMPNLTYLFYKTGANDLSYMVCISQETAGVDMTTMAGLTDDNWWCTGDDVDDLKNDAYTTGFGGTGTFRNSEGTDIVAVPAGGGTT